MPGIPGEREERNMTQKEITDAKKKAKECLDIFDIKVPMTKMNVLFYYFGVDEEFFINFFDVRTHDYFTCDYKNGKYNLIINLKNDVGTHIFHACKGGETND